MCGSFVGWGGDEVSWTFFFYEGEGGKGGWKRGIYEGGEEKLKNEADLQRGCAFLVPLGWE